MNNVFHSKKRVCLATAISLGMMTYCANVGAQGFSFGGDFGALTSVASGDTIRYFNNANDYFAIYVGAGIDPNAYRSLYGEVSPPTVISAATVSLMPQSEGYRYFAAAFRQNGIYSLRVTTGGDAIAAIYAQPGSSGLPFNSSSLLTNLIAFSDDTLTGTNIRNPQPVFYEQTSGACTVIQFLVYEYNGNGADLTGTFAVEGPGPIATDCNALGPNAANTLIALQENAAATRAVLNIRAAAAANALEHDCPVFDSRGICVMVGGRYGQVGSDNHEFAGLVTAAFRLSPDVRIGTFADYAVSGGTPDGLRMRSRAPMFGGFIVYEEARDFTGLRLRGSLTYQDGSVRVTRRVLPDTEPGQGTGDLRTFGFGVEASYGFSVAQGWAVAPYGGIRRVESARNQYAEASGEAVLYPIRYDSFGQYVTSAVAGLRVRGALTDGLTFIAGVGVEYDLSAKMDRYAGSSDIYGLERFAINMGQNANEVRGAASIGLRYALAANQQVMVDAGVRQTPYSNEPSVSTMLRYAVGF